MEKLLKQLGKFALKLAIMQAVIDVFRIIGKATSDSAKETNDFTKDAIAGMDKYREAISAVRDEVKGLSKDLPQNREDLKNTSLLEGTAIGGASRAVLGEEAGNSAIRNTENFLTGDKFGQGSFITSNISKLFGGEGVVSYAEKAANDQAIAFNEMMSVVNETLSESYSQLGVDGQGANELGQLSKVDGQLRDLNQQRQATPVSDSDTRLKIEKQINDLLKEREKLSGVTGALQGNQAQQIEFLEKYKEQLDELKNAPEPGITEADYEFQINMVNSALEGLNKTQEGFNNLTRQSADELKLLSRALNEVMVQLQSETFRNQITAGQQSVNLAKARLSGATEGETQYSGALIQRDQLNTQITSNSRAATGLENNLGSQLFIDALKKVDLSLESTSFDIQNEIDKIDDGDLKSNLEKIVKGRADLENLQLDTLNLEEQMIQAQIEANEQVRNANREIEEYFRGVAEQSDELALQVQEVSSNTKFNEIKSALKSSMSGLSGTFFDDWLGGFMEFLDTLNGMVQTRIDADRQAQQLAQQQLQSQMQSAQMGRSLPGNAQGVSNGGSAVQSGLLTGPSAYIGGSAANHIDHKIPKAIGEEMAIQFFDQLAAGYAEQGRRIEFSNSAVSGEVWDINASMEEKRAMLNRVDAAHSHSPNPTYWDADYYVPRIGDSRSASPDSSSAGANMLMPQIAGGSTEFNQARRYGNFVNVYGENGELLFKMGHGDNRQQLPSNFTMQSAITASIPQQQTQFPSQGGSLLPSLGSGYGSLESLASTLSQNDNFDTSSGEGRAALALALGIGGSEVYSQGSTQQDFFTRRGGTDNNMLGFGQFNLAYHRENTDTPDEYMNFMGSTLRGQNALPNGRQGRNFAGELAQLVDSGGITSGQQLIEFTQSGGNSGLGGSNWQGIDDGWSRVPGLADSLVSYLQGSPSGTSSGINSTPAVNRNQFQGGQQLNDQNFQLQQNLLEQSTQSQLQLANIEANLQAQGVVSQSNRQSQDLQDQTLEFQQQIQDRIISALPESSESRSQIGGLIDNARQDASGVTNTSRQRQRFQQQLDAAGPLREAAMLARTQKVEQVDAGLIDPSQIENIDIQISGLDKIIEDATNALNVLNELDKGTIDFAFAQELVNLDTQIEQLSIAGNKLSPAEAATVALSREVEALETNMEGLTEIYRQSQIEAGHTGENLEILVSKFEDANNIRLDNARVELERLEEAARSAQEAALIEIRTEGLGELTRVLNRSGQPQQAQELNYQNQLRQIDADEQNRLREVEQDPRLDDESRELALNEARDTFSNRRENAAYDNDMLQRSSTLDTNESVLGSRRNLFNAHQEQADMLGFGGIAPLKQEEMNLALGEQQNSYERELQNLNQLMDAGKLTTGAFDEMRAAIEATNELSIDNIKTQFSDLPEIIGAIKQPMTDALGAWIQGTKSFDEAFSGMLSSIFSNLVSMMANKAIEGLLGSLLGGMGGSGGGQTGGIGGILGSVFGGIFEDGGKVGSSRSSMAYQGLDNIKSALKQEGPKGRIIVANTDEWVLNKDHQRMLAEYGITDKTLGFKDGGKVGPSPSISVPNGNSSVSVSMPLTVNNQGGSDLDGSELLKAIQDPVKSLIATQIEKQQRPGGQLRRRR